MYKYETLGKEIIKFLDEQKKNGNRTCILRATEVNKMFEVSQICGGQRYPMICQAMEYATQKYKGIQIDGKNPSSSFTVEYKLTLL